MQVKLLIKKVILQDYLNHLFQKDTKGSFIVERTEDFGKLITSRVKYSNTPIRAQGENLINFVLPHSRPLACAESYYLFISKEDEQKINDGLEAIFNIDFDRYYLQGRKLKMQQKDIIQSFILSRKLISHIGDNETLKKRQYRDELKIQKKYADQLIKKAYNRHERIDESLKTSNDLLINYL